MSLAELVFLPEFYGSGCRSMKRKAIISTIVLLICIIATVALRFAVDRVNADYREVKATVVSSETKQVKVLGSRQTVYEVIVRYEGQRYDLKNTHGTAAYQPGREVTVYLSNGELYANIEGVKTATPLAKVYFGSLFASFAMVVVTVTLISKARHSS